MKNLKKSWWILAIIAAVVAYVVYDYYSFCVAKKAVAKSKAWGLFKYKAPVAATPVASVPAAKPTLGDLAKVAIDNTAGSLI